VHLRHAQAKAAAALLADGAKTPEKQAFALLF
jgi:hypothetical protein